MIKIAAAHLQAVNNAATGADLHALLQEALRLEFATVPPYLTAAYSLKLGANNGIRNLIVRVAEEEMLHMAIVANVLNAVGGQPRFDDPARVPTYPGPLPMSIGGGLVVGLKKFSKELVKDVFMKIEEPENPLHFPQAGGPVTFATIGAFYQAMIDKIVELGDAIFTGDPARQVFEVPGFPAGDLVAVTNVDTAVTALKRIARDGEGTTASPLDASGDLAHYYRFESIVHGKQLVANPSVPQGFSFTGPVIPFDAAGIWDFPDDTKTADYAAGTPERQLVADFNIAYSVMLRQLQVAFDGQPETIDAVVGLMGGLRLKAVAVVSHPNPATGRQCGLTFEYVP
jgi:hypothetical protein